MKHFVHTAANPPRWCALSPGQWREQWRNALTADDSPEGRPGLGWTEHTRWGQLRWRAATYYDALALAEGSAGATMVEQVVVYDPSQSRPPAPEPMRRMRWWRWRRNSPTLTWPPSGAVRSCRGTEDVLEGVVARVNELDRYLPLLDSVELSCDTSALAYRLLWEGVGLADSASSVRAARFALLGIQDRLYELSLATWQARKSLVARRGQGASAETFSTAAELQGPVDAALRKLRKIADHAPEGRLRHAEADGSRTNAVPQQVPKRVPQGVPKQVPNL